MAQGQQVNDGAAGRKVLAVFAKWPQPGLVKTRLAAATSQAWAAQVAEAFLLDFTDKLAGLDAERALQDDVRRAAKDPRASGRSRVPG